MALTLADLIAGNFSTCDAATVTVATSATDCRLSDTTAEELPVSVAVVAAVSVATPDFNNLSGLSLAELKTAAGDDWAEIEHDPAMLKAFAHALMAQAMRERCEVPSHYTQAVNCDGCGPVWLWQGPHDRVLACPWCFVRVKGIKPPVAVLPAAAAVSPDADYLAAGMVRCRQCSNRNGPRCRVDNAAPVLDKWRRCDDFMRKL